MRRIVQLTAIAAIALLTQAGCVQSQYIPSNVIVPTASPTPAAPPMSANPPALTLSVSASVPPNGSFPTVTVTQNGATSPPVVITAQSTCLNNGNLFIVNTFSGGFSSTFQLQAVRTGSCVLVFGGIGGVTLILPVSVIP